MHPKTLEYFEHARNRGLSMRDWPMKIMAGPHHFHIAKAVYEAIDAIATHEISGLADGDFMVPCNARLPAETCTLTVDIGRDVCFASCCTDSQERKGW